MKKITTSLAITATLISSVAGANPFGAKELHTVASLQLAEAEMKCGANMKMDTPATITEQAVDNKKTEVKNAVEKKVTDAATTSTSVVPAIPGLGN